MKIGISTACLYPMETERALQTLLERGFSLFEVFFNCDGEMEPTFLDRLRRQAAAYEARFCSVHFYTAGFESMMFFSDYPRRFAESMERYRRNFSAARRLGASYAVMHGGKEQCVEDAVYFERYHALFEAAREEGITLLLENVRLHKSASPEFIRRMRQALGPQGAAFNFDLKQAVRAGVDPFAMLEAMGEEVRNIHINDCNAQGDCLLPGEGTFDFALLAQKLKEMQYSGDLLIEVYSNNFTQTEQLISARDFLERIFK